MIVKAQAYPLFVTYTGEGEEAEHITAMVLGWLPAEQIGGKPGMFEPIVAERDSDHWRLMPDDREVIGYVEMSKKGLLNLTGYVEGLQSFIDEMNSDR